MIVDQKISRNIVGAYLLDGDINGAKLGLSVKPNKLRILFIKLFLGWKWVTIDELKVKKDGNKL